MNLRLFAVLLIVMAAAVAGLTIYGYTISPEKRPIQVEVGDAP